VHWLAGVEDVRTLKAQKQRLGRFAKRLFRVANDPESKHILHNIRVIKQTVESSKENQRIAA